MNMNCYYCGKSFESTSDAPSAALPFLSVRPTCPECLGAAATLLNNRRLEFEQACAEEDRIQKLNAVTLAFNGEQIQELRRILGDFIVDLGPRKEFVSSGSGNREWCPTCKASATTGSYRSYTDPDHGKDKPLTHRTDCTHLAAERWFKELRTRLEEASGTKVAPDLGPVFKVPVEISNATLEQLRAAYAKR